jgi:hypothetical protein
MKFAKATKFPQEIRGRAGRGIAKIVERWRRGTTYIRGAAPPALGRCCGIDVPALPGWAEVWLPALRAWVRFAVYFRVPTQTLNARTYPTAFSRPLHPTLAKCSGGTCGFFLLKTHSKASPRCHPQLRPRFALSWRKACTASTGEPVWRWAVFAARPGLDRSGRRERCRLRRRSCS